MCYRGVTQGTDNKLIGAHQIVFLVAQQKQTLPELQVLDAAPRLSYASRSRHSDRHRKINSGLFSQHFCVPIPN